MKNRLMSPGRLAAMAGIDVTKKAFWEESLGICAKLIDEFIELTK